MTDILPCPFCGSADLTLTVDRFGWKVVQCDDCGTSGPCIDLEGEQYIERWNTRTGGVAQASVNPLIEEAMWMLQDVPGDTLIERIARLTKWYQELTCSPVSSTERDFPAGATGVGLGGDTQREQNPSALSSTERGDAT